MGEDKDKDPVARILHVELYENGAMILNVKSIDSLDLMAIAYQLLTIARNDQTEAGNTENATLVASVMEPLDALLQMTGAVYNTEPKSAPVN